MTLTAYYDFNKKQRSCSDRSHLFIFLMAFALWAGLGIYAYSTSISLFDVISPTDYKKFNDLLASGLSEGRFVTVGSIWLSIFFLGLYFMIINWLPKWTTYVTCFLSVVFSAVMIILSYWIFPLPSIFGALFFIILFISVVFIYTIQKAGTYVVCKIIKDSLSVMLHFPSAALMVVIQIALISLILSCSVVIMFYLYAPYYKKPIDGQKEDALPKFVFFLAFINVCFAFWMSFFISHVGRAILHGNFITWYQADNKNAVSKNVFSIHMKNTFSYHLGTLAFGSSIFTKIQVLRATFGSRAWLSYLDLGNMVKFAYFFIILGYSTTNALIFNVVFGKNSFEATKASINFLMRNDLKFIAVRGITRWMVVFGLVCIPLIPYAFALSYFADHRENFTPIAVIMSLDMIGWVNFFIASVFIYLFDIAIEAVLFCHLYEENSNEKENKDRILFNEHLNSSI